MSAGAYFMSPATYDAVYGGFTADLPLALELLRGAGGPALEVCCGNGRVLLPALRAGIPCDGLDLSREMLDDLRSKLAAQSLSAELYEADMRDFTLPKRYALIFIAFNSFLHNLTQADQLATLRACHRHLAPGGRLALVAFHPSAEKLIEYSNGEHLAVERLVDGALLRVYDHARDDRIEQVRTVSRRIERLDEDGRVTSEERHTFEVRYVFKPEMELLLRVAGFSRWDVAPAFSDYSDPASMAAGRAPREGDHLQWTAWA